MLPENLVWFPLIFFTKSLIHSPFLREQHPHFGITWEKLSWKKRKFWLTCFLHWRGSLRPYTSGWKTVPILYLLLDHLWDLHHHVLFPPLAVCSRLLQPKKDCLLFPKQHYFVYCRSPQSFQKNNFLTCKLIGQFSIDSQGFLLELSFMVPLQSYNLTL